MVSDFIEEKGGYLALTQQQYDHIKVNNPSTRMNARQLLEYGESKEEYWTSDRFMSQIRQAVKIVEVKYLKSDGWRVVWIFDHSSCHSAMSDDALDVSKMNVNPGRKQRVMRDGFWDGKAQRMVTSAGIPKEMRIVLEERGVNTHAMTREKMREVLACHADFKHEKSRIERCLVDEKGYIVYMLPKFHCEPNPIERVWAQSKRCTKAYCEYNIQSLHNNIIPALDTVILENMQNYFRKVRHYVWIFGRGSWWI